MIEMLLIFIDVTGCLDGLHVFFFLVGPHKMKNVSWTEKLSTVGMEWWVHIYTHVSAYVHINILCISENYGSKLVLSCIEASYFNDGVDVLLEVSQLRRIGDDI